GFTTVLQAWDFRPGSNFAVDMHDALRRSDRVLALLSEAYLASAFAASEWAAAFATDPTGRQGRLLPVRVGECQPDGLLHGVVYVDLVGGDPEEAKRRLLAAVRQGRSKPPTLPAFPGARTPGPAAQSFPGALPGIWNVPARNPNFAGRDPQLDQLRDVLKATRSGVATVAVSGLGGVGKTQLALEHAWRRASDYDLVWWVPAEVLAAVPGYLTPLAEGLGLPTDDPAAVVALLHGELQRRDRWLLVFDNAENPEALNPYLPSAGRGHVVITSRNPAWRSRAEVLDVDVLSPEESVTFLLRRTSSADRETASAVAEELAHLPLALEQAAAYVEETGMSLGEYRRLLAARRRDLLGRGTPAFYRQTVASTFGLAYDRVSSETPAVADVLGTCAFLGPDDIPVDLVAGDDRLAVEDALAALRRLALVRRQGDAIAVHRLVSAVVRDRLTPEERTRRAQDAAAALAAAFPNPADDHRSWPRSARLLPHVVVLARHAEAAGKDLADVLNQAGIYLSSRAQIRQARDVLDQALRMKESAYGPDDPEVGITLSNLGIVLRALGDLDAARSCQERALRLFEAAYGSDDPEVAVTLSNLGIVLRALGDLEGARAHHERALGIFEVAYGSDHPEVAHTLANLGIVLQDLGDLQSAQAHHERALRIFEATRGVDDPEVAVTISNLAIVLRELGDLETARAHHQRALAIFEAAYGVDHPEVGITLTNLAIVLRTLGDAGAARAQLERALRIFEMAYGPDHPLSRTTRSARDALRRD
ncbi:MAG: FxSxx-COOH system tetratricopeptide repeat protein, partial [Actinomycetota bacterium]|nr:FxSxx-COOH system tetratricopeptide repeat protein [Actinomycetota bacterium]